MMPSCSLSGLKQGRWHEHFVRFALGGSATVLTGVIAKTCSAQVGGLFLALPAIFCASATLVERHEARRKREAGFCGSRPGREAAALDAAGASLGSLGMLAFALCFAVVVTIDVVWAFVAASAAWTGTALWLGGCGGTSGTGNDGGDPMLSKTA